VDLDPSFGGQTHGRGGNTLRETNLRRRTPLIRMRTLLLAGLAALLLTAAPAGAVIGGTPDRDAHPYVGLVWSSTGICTGSLISPTLFVTAAHCAPGGEIVGVTLDTAASPFSRFTPGLFVPHPRFCMGCGSGLPGFDTHDVAVVRLHPMMPLAAPRYAQLPEIGAIDALGGRTPLTVVGYGVQGFAAAPRDPDGNVIPGRVPYSDFTRTQASVTLVPGKFAWSDEFARISASRAGICFGDSGGPNLVGDTVVAINAYANQNCAGATYSYRLDTPAALRFVNSFR
jgi:hypothetical protein